MSTRGSTDHTQQVFEKFGRRIRSFRQGNQGAAARNRALDEAKGDLIIFLDADDTLDGDAVAALIAGYDRAIRLEKNRRGSLRRVLALLRRA